MILHVCDYCDIRTLKEVIELQTVVPVTLLYGRCNHPDVMAYVMNQSSWSGDTLDSKLRAFVSAADCVHLHQGVIESEVFLRRVVEASGEKLVYDVHDYTDMTKRLLDANPETRIIHPGGMDVQLPYRNKTIIYSKVPSCLVPDIFTHERSGSILVSGVSESPYWRDYRHIQDRWWDVFGERLFILPANSSERVAVIFDNVLTGVPYKHMLAKIKGFRFGYAGAANDTHNIDTCVTNKFWEYLSCGITPVLWRASAMAEICKKYEYEFVSIDADSFCSGYYESDGIHGKPVKIPDMSDEIPRLLICYSGESE